MALPESDDASLLGLAPSPRQTRWAILVAGALVVGFGALIPISGTPLSALNAVFPSLDAIVLVTSLVTAVLIFARYSITRLRPLLVLASGYLFTALIVIPHALTFSGAFSPTGLLGATVSTGSWLYIFWHAGFAVAVLGYAAFPEANGRRSTPQGTGLPAIAASVALVTALVCGLAWLATAGNALLPPLIAGTTRLSSTVTYYVSVVIVISAAALVALALAKRSVMNLWLMVATLAAILELVLSGLLPSVRFSLGFYAGRIFSLVTASLILIVLLAETTQLHVRLARSNLRLRREQNNKLMTVEAMTASISHELGQPLAAIKLTAAALERFLAQVPPKLPEARDAVADIAATSGRIVETLRAVRSLFAKAALVQEPIDLNELVLATLRLMDTELKSHRVATRVELGPALPPTIGHRGQLEEVMVNLVHNAIEAMDAVTEERRVLTLRTARDGGDALVVEVVDSGPGIDPQAADEIFDPFFTTKPQGMGLGLAICRIIVERHGGRLSSAAAAPHGAIFRMALPFSA